MKVRGRAAKGSVPRDIFHYIDTTMDLPSENFEDPNDTQQRQLPKVDFERMDGLISRVNSEHKIWRRKKMETEEFFSWKEPKIEKSYPKTKNDSTFNLLGILIDDHLQRIHYDNYDIEELEEKIGSKPVPLEWWCRFRAEGNVLNNYTNQLLEREKKEQRDIEKHFKENRDDL